MKNFKATLLTMFILVAGSFNAKQTASKMVSQQPVDNQSLFGTSQASREDFWKIFGEGLSEFSQESTKKIPQKDAVMIVNIMNNISDTFNRDYSFTEFNPLKIVSSLTTFLENPKNQLLLKKLPQVIKDNVAVFPERFANIAVNLEQSINNKNAKQFYVIYTSLEQYFRGAGAKPLARISQAGWLTTIKNAIMNRARRTYYYLFGSKDQGFDVISKYIITSYQDSSGKPVTRLITEKTDATGRVISYEEVKK